MAFPTASEIARIGQIQQQNSPLAQLGRLVAGGFQGYQAGQERKAEQAKAESEQQAQQGAAQKQAKAASLIQQAVQNPDQAEVLVAQAATLDPEFVNKVFQARNAGAKGQNEPKPITDYQKASIELRREQLDLDKLKAQQAKASNDLRKEQLQVAIDAKKSKLQENEMAIKDSVAKDVATFDSTLNTVDQLINHEGLDAAVGGSSIFPTVAGSDAANFEAKLEQLKSQQFLTEIQKMKGLGALSENEGKKLGAAAASLDLRMSEDAFREELKYIQDTMQKARNKIAGKLPKNEDGNSQGARQVDQLSDEELLKSLGL